MHAIGNYLNEHNPSLKILYVTSENFTNEIVNSLRSDKKYNTDSMSVLKDKYRNTAIRKMCGKIETYERMSAKYIADHRPESIPEEGIGGYDLLDTLDDKFIDKMRSDLHVWKDIKSMA